MTRSGGLRFAPTPGYSLATLRVANADDESSMSLPLQWLPRFVLILKSPGVQPLLSHLQKPLTADRE